MRINLNLNESIDLTDDIVMLVNEADVDETDVDLTDEEEIEVDKEVYDAVMDEDDPVDDGIDIGDAEAERMTYSVTDIIEDEKDDFLMDSIITSDDLLEACMSEDDDDYDDDDIDDDDDEDDDYDELTETSNILYVNEKGIPERAKVFSKVKGKEMVKVEQYIVSQLKNLVPDADKFNVRINVSDSSCSMEFFAFIGGTKHQSYDLVDQGLFKEKDVDNITKQVAKQIRNCPNYKPGKVNKFKFVIDA